MEPLGIENAENQENGQWHAGEYHNEQVAPADGGIVILISTGQQCYRGSKQTGRRKQYGKMKNQFE
jgi:hypothetical protein